MFQHLHLLKNATDDVTECVNRATLDMVQRRQAVFTPVVLLWGLLHAPPTSLIARVLARQEARSDFQEDLAKHVDEIRKQYSIQEPITHTYMAAEIEHVFRIANRETKELGDSFISTGTLFLALFDPRCGPVARMLRESGLEYGEIRELYKSVRNGRPITEPDMESKAEILNQYGRDLLLEAKRGKLAPVIGRTQEIGRITQILLQVRKGNPLLVGDPGVGKTAIVEGLAQHMTAGQVPDKLSGRPLYEISLNAMVAGAKFRGEFEERLKVMIDEAVRLKAILFIDEFHSLVGAGASQGALDASNILKPALASGHLQIIGATTHEEHLKHLAPDGALMRRFDTVRVDEPTPEETLKILEGCVDYYASRHEVTYAPDAITKAVELSVRYLPDQQLPDKAITILDRAGVKGYLRNASSELRQRRDQVAQKRIDTFAQGDYEEAARIQTQLTDLEEQLKREQGQARVRSEDIYQVVAEASRIPIDQIRTTDAKRFLDAEVHLSQRVQGQDEALRVIADALRANAAGLRDSGRPIGSFLFLGPTGVGKTETAKALADHLFEGHLIRVDMNEFQERHEASKLIGAPPGYVGYGEGGQLTERVRRHPYSVVLFDELEKAHPDVFNLLLQILDEGQITDGNGRKTSFRNCIVIMTSNAGQTWTQPKKQVGFGGEVPDPVPMALRQLMRPEFLARLDAQVRFSPLGQNRLLEIARKYIQQISARLPGIEIVATDRLLAGLVDEALQHAEGARAIRHLVERRITPLVARRKLQEELPKTGSVLVDLEDGEVSLRIEETIPAA